MNNQKGQVLLITAMLLATVLTVTLAVTFKSATDTQIAKLEEEQQKTLAAAEAGVEAVLNNVVSTTVSIGSLPGLSTFSGTAEIGTASPGETFVSPLVQKDQQYTFYLADQSFSTLWSGNLELNFKSDGPGCPSIELTFIRADNTMERSVMDPCSNISGGPKLGTTNPGDTIDGFNFAYKSSSAITILGNYKLLLVRSLFGSTRFGFRGDSFLPIQGKSVTSEARAESGITKVVKLFQSYPQIQADFFVTSF